jgi:hypothetical protein
MTGLPAGLLEPPDGFELPKDFCIAFSITRSKRGQKYYARIAQQLLPRTRAREVMIFHNRRGIYLSIFVTKRCILALNHAVNANPSLQTTLAHTVHPAHLLFVSFRVAGFVVRPKSSNNLPTPLRYKINTDFRLSREVGSNRKDDEKQVSTKSTRLDIACRGEAFFFCI